MSGVVSERMLVGKCRSSAELSTGAQVMTLDYSVMPLTWFTHASGSALEMLSSDGAKNSVASVECDVFDVFATTGEYTGSLRH